MTNMKISRRGFLKSTGASASVLAISSIVPLAASANTKVAERGYIITAGRMGVLKAKIGKRSPGGA